MPLVELSEPYVATHILRVSVRPVVSVAPIPRAWGTFSDKKQRILN